VVVATWYGSHTHQQRSGNEITTATLVRSHIAFADEITTNKSTVPDLLLPLMVLKALHVRKARSYFDGMGWGLLSVLGQ
jgi:MoxR-like ATPase